MADETVVIEEKIEPAESKIPAGLKEVRDNNIFAGLDKPDEKKLDEKKPDAKKIDLPDFIEANFDEDEPADKKEPVDKPITKRDYAKYSKYFGDKKIESDEDFDRELEAAFEEKNKLKVLAQGRGKIDKDEKISGLKGLMKHSDEELYILTKADQFMKNGLAQDKAEAKARERLEAEKKKPEYATFIEDYGLDVRGRINGAIEGRSAELQQELEKAGSSLDLSPENKKNLTKALNEVAKLEGFSAFRVPEKYRAEFQKGVKSFIESGEYEKALNVPENILDVAAYLKDKEKWNKNIRSLHKEKAPAKTQVPSVVSGSKKPNNMGGIEKKAPGQTQMTREQAAAF